MYKSKLDSERFNMEIHRAVVTSVEVKEISKYLIENEVDILIIRLDAANKNEHSKLASLGMPYLHCDTLVYYECKLENHKVEGLRNHLVFEKVEASNSHKLEKMVPIIFNDYTNHYTSNPKLDKAKILEGYKEWALNHCTPDDDRISWIVLNENGTEVGFATCSYNSQERICEGVLYGILPDKSGGGVYGDMIRFTQNYFKERNYVRMVVSTQVQNYAVQKVWAREGFYMFKAWDTYHINSFLYDRGVEYRDKVSFSIDDIEKFGAFSGDMNPVHFDDNFAKESGFKSRIVHGIKFELFLTKVLGQEWPGNGTIILDNKVVFKRPIYPDVNHQLSIKCTESNGRGFKSLVSKLVDFEGNLVCLAYTNVIKK